MKNKTSSKFSINPSSAFTIVELLVVIVVIGILASITIVSYIGVVQKTKVASLKADLSTSAQRIKLFQVDNDFYPHQINDCPSPATTNLCLTPSNNSTYDYTVNNSTNPQSFTLIATADDNITKYQITEDGGITEVAVAPASNFFAVAWGGESFDAGLAIQTSDGGYAMAGTTESYGAGNGDAFLAKYTADGTLSWSRTWGGSEYDSAFSLIQTIDGGYVIYGETFSYGSGDSDAFIAKYTSDGTLSWSRTWGGLNEDGSGSITQTSDGGYVLAGSTGSYGAGSFDAFLAKYTSDGTLSWSRTWGGVDNDSAFFIIQTSDGGYAIAGETHSYSSNYNPDAYLAKFSSDGTLSWSRTWGLGSVDYDSINSIVQVSDGGFVVVGATYSYGAGDSDAFLAKYTADGTLSWSRTWGGTSSDYAVSLIQTSDGGYAMAGYTESYGAGDGDAFLAKYTADGTLSWSRTWGGLDADGFGSVAQASDGGYILAGYTGSYGAGDSDAVLAKYNADGVIDDCASSMCQDITPSVSSPTIPVDSPIVTVTSPTASVSSPTPTVTSPTATHTVIVAP